MTTVKILRYRLERMIDFKKELIELSGNDELNFVQKKILSNIDGRIADMEKHLATATKQEPKDEATKGER